MSNYQTGHQSWNIINQPLKNPNNGFQLGPSDKEVVTPAVVVKDKRMVAKKMQEANWEPILFKDGATSLSVHSIDSVDDLDFSAVSSSKIRSKTSSKSKKRGTKSHRVLLDQLRIEDSLPVDQTKMDESMSYVELGVERGDTLEHVYDEHMRVGNYAYDIIVPHHILEPFRQFVPAELQPEYRYNIFSQEKELKTHYAYLGCHGTGTGIHWDIFSSIGINQMVGIYYPDKKADVCIIGSKDKDIKAQKDSMYAIWVFGAPQHREALLSKVHNLATGKRFLHWRKISDLGLPCVFLKQSIGDIVIIPPGWLHQVSNVSHDMDKDERACLKIAWNVLHVKDLPLTNAEYEVHRAYHRDTTYVVRASAFRCLSNLLNMHKHSDKDKEVVRTLYSTLSHWFDEIRLDIDVIPSLTPNKDCLTSYMCSRCATDLFVFGFNCSSCYSFLICHKCVLMNDTLCHPENYKVVRTNDVAFEDVDKTLSKARSHLEQWNIQIEPNEVPKFTCAMALQKIEYERSKMMLQKFQQLLLNDNELKGKLKKCHFFEDEENGLVIRELTQLELIIEATKVEQHYLWKFNSRNILRFAIKAITPEDVIVLNIHQNFLSDNHKVQMEILLGPMKPLVSILNLLNDKPEDDREGAIIALTGILQSITDIGNKAIKSKGDVQEPPRKKQRLPAEGFCLSIGKLVRVCDSIDQWYYHNEQKNIIFMI